MSGGKYACSLFRAGDDDDKYKVNGDDGDDNGHNDDDGDDGDDDDDDDDDDGV